MRLAPAFDVARTAAAAGVGERTLRRRLDTLKRRGVCGDVAAALASCGRAGFAAVAVTDPRCPPNVAATVESVVIDTASGAATGVRAWPWRAPRERAGRLAAFLAGNPRLGRRAVVGAAGRDDSRLMLARSSTALTVLMFDSLSDNPDTADRILQNPACPPRVLNRFAADPSNKLRCYVAEHPHSPPTVLALLATDPDPMVRAHIASNPRCGADLLRSLAIDHDANVRTTAINNDACPAETVTQRLHDISSEVVAAAVRRGASPDLDSLAGSSHYEVRAAVASNRHTAPELLQKLATDHFDDVRWDTAQNPACSPQLLTQLAQDPGRAVRSAVAANPSCPRSVLMRLAEDPKPEVRAVAAAHCAPNDIAAAAADSDMFVRAAVAEREDLDHAVYETLAQDSDVGCALNGCGQSRYRSVAVRDARERHRRRGS